MVTVGVRDLKSHLSEYLARVKAGETVVITERGKPIGRIEPQIAPGSQTAEDQMRRLAREGIIEWNGERLSPAHPAIRLRGGVQLSDIVIEGRGPR